LSEPKISDFKMLETAPQEIPEPRALLEAFMMGLKESEKFYGPAFTSRTIKWSLKFIAEKIGEKPPEDIKDLSQLAEYLVSISNKYPIPANAVYYASLMFENFLEGQVGVGTRVASTSISRDWVKSPIREKRDVDVDGIVSKYRKTLIELGVATYEFGYKKNTDESVDVLWKCFFNDVCNSALYDGILKRSRGSGLQCAAAQFLCQFFKTSTNYDFDYDLLELDKPYCVTRLYIV
jgi:hypothetical protein